MLPRSIRQSLSRLSHIPEIEVRIGGVRVGTGPKLLCYDFGHGAARTHRENQATSSG